MSEPLRHQLRRTSTPGKVPTTTDLLVRELGLNTVDKKLYINLDGTEILHLTGVDALFESSTRKFVTAAQKTLLEDLDATATELNYMVGVTSGVQAQLDAKMNTGDTIDGGTFVGA